MKSLIISILISILMVFFIFHIKNKNEEQQNELLILSYQKGYLDGFSNCKKDSMIYLEESFSVDSLEFSEIVFK